MNGAPNGNGSIRTVMLQMLFAVVLLMAGAIGTMTYQRLSGVEGTQSTLIKDTGAIERRVTTTEDVMRVIDARVTVLEGGRRVQFDIKLDRALLEQQVEEEVQKQLDAGTLKKKEAKP